MKKEKKPSSLSRLMNYAGSYKLLTYLSLVLSAISAVFALLPFYYLWLIIKEVLDVRPNFENAVTLRHNAVLAVVFAISAMVLYVGALMCSHFSAFRVQANLRKELMRHILSLPLGAVSSLGSGKVRKTVNECSAATETYLAHQLPDSVAAAVTPVGLVAFLFIFDWRFGLFCLIPIALSFVLMMTQMTGENLKTKMKEYQDALDDMSNEAVEYVRGIPVVKTFGQTVYSFERFKKSIERYSSWAIDYTKSLRTPMALFTTIINGIFAFILIAAMFFARGGVTSDLILNTLFYIIFTPILTVTMTKMMFQSENKMIVEDALERIDGLLNISPLGSEKNGSVQNTKIELQNVCYSYDGAKNAIDGVSLSIEPGNTVAFVGPSGGGKTTLANLIARFFDATDGKVLIGGKDVRSIEPKELMNNVSFVFQNSRLIKGTIADNVKLAKPDADEARVLFALHLAQCDDIIESLPDGINTVIGSDGIYLSGGQQQRIAIARAILKNAPILILDEATAYADPDNELKVQQAISALAKNKTVIMIAHRLSTVMGADYVYVLEDGKITESGTPSKLLESGGKFAKMTAQYSSAVNWSVAKEEAK